MDSRNHTEKRVTSQGRWQSLCFARMSPINVHLETNRQTWNAVADLFSEASALPCWGPFGVGDDLPLLPDIVGKTFLEIACGSGRSLAYLLERGAWKVYGLDLSEVQVHEALRFNARAVQEGKAVVLRGPMESRVDIEPVDVVFSVYGLGWTQDPDTTLEHIFYYLKPGGIFVWSWDHGFFTDVAYEGGQYVVRHSYHEELPLERPDWKKPGCTVHLTYRKTDTWFRLIRNAGFQVTNYYEPAPKNLSHAHAEPEAYYSIKKAKLVPSSFIFVCQKPQSSDEK